MLTSRCASKVPLTKKGIWPQKLRLVCRRPEEASQTLRVCSMFVFCQVYGTLLKVPPYNERRVAAKSEGRMLMSSKHIVKQAMRLFTGHCFVSFTCILVYSGVFMLWRIWVGRAVQGSVWMFFEAGGCGPPPALYCSRSKWFCFHTPKPEGRRT